MQYLRITKHTIARRLNALNSDAVAHGCWYDAIRTGQLWVIYVRPKGATMPSMVADCLSTRECWAMLNGLLRGRQHQHDDRLRTVFGPTALGQVTPAQPDPSRLCCDHCAVGLTHDSAHFVESLSRDCASANAGESATLCGECIEREECAPAAVTSRGLETADGDAVCEFCNRVGPGRPAVMGEDTVHYCEACRSADAG